MPTTWGYGAAGDEAITMAGWGFLSDLAGTVSENVPVAFDYLEPLHLFTHKGAKHKFAHKGSKYRFTHIKR